MSTEDKHFHSLIEEFALPVRRLVGRGDRAIELYEKLATLAGAPKRPEDHRAFEKGIVALRTLIPEDAWG